MGKSHSKESSELGINQQEIDKWIHSNHNNHLLDNEEIERYRPIKKQGFFMRQKQRRTKRVSPVKRIDENNNIQNHNKEKDIAIHIVPSVPNVKLQQKEKTEKSIKNKVNIIEVEKENNQNDNPEERKSTVLDVAEREQSFRAMFTSRRSCAALITEKEAESDIGSDTDEKMIPEESDEIKDWLEETDDEFDINNTKNNHKQNEQNDNKKEKSGRRRSIQLDIKHDNQVINSSSESLPPWSPDVRIGAKAFDSPIGSLDNDDALSSSMLEKNPLYRIMRQVQVFCNLSQKQQEEALKILKPIHFNQGECIVRQGERGDRFYMIAKGEAVVTKTLESENRETMITHLYPGHYFGELALIYDDPRSATVTAITDVELLYLTHADFHKIGQVHLSLILRQVPLIAQLNSRDQDFILTQLRPVNFRDGEYIVRQGEQGDRFYLVVKGEAVVTEYKNIEKPDEGERELTKLYEGHIFGEISLICDEPRTASVRAIGNVKCLYLTKQNFTRALKTDRFYSYIQNEYIEKATKRAMRRQRTDPTDDGNESPRSMHPSESDMSLPMSVKSLQTIETKKLIKQRLANGEKVVNNYIIKGDIGKGMYGRVKLCFNEEDKTLYAVKIMQKSFFQRLASKDDQIEDSLRREVAIMKKLDHKNVIHLKEVIDDPSSQKIYLVQEWIEKGNLMQIMGDYGKPLDEERARKFFRQMLNGLDYLHFNKIVHRDLKPENILVTSDDVVKIADFGAARIVLHETERLHGAKGTPAFMAPEMFDVNAMYTGPSADIWSLGVTLYMMIIGTTPWMADNQIELARKVQHDELVFPLNHTIDPHLRNLIQRMLTKDPSRRITLPDIIRHEWVTKEGTEPLDYENLEEDTTNIERKRLTINDYDCVNAIQNIPERIKMSKLAETLEISYNMLKTRESKPNAFSETRSSRRISGKESISEEDISGESDNEYDPQIEENGSICEKHCYNDQPIDRTIRIERKDSNDKRFVDAQGDEVQHVMLAWRQHKRAELLEEYKGISEKSKNSLLEQKRNISFSAERAEATEILLPAAIERDEDNSNGKADEEINGNLKEKIPSMDSSCPKRLERKNDFVMVTSDILVDSVGEIQKRKVLFQAKGEDFSIASKPFLNSFASSSGHNLSFSSLHELNKSIPGSASNDFGHHIGGSESNNHSRMGSRTSSMVSHSSLKSLSEELASSHKSSCFREKHMSVSSPSLPMHLSVRVPKAIPKSQSLNLLDVDVQIIQSDEEGENEEEEQEDLLDESPSNTKHRGTWELTESTSDESDTYSEVHSDVNIEETFDELAHGSPHALFDSDPDIAPLEPPSGKSSPFQTIESTSALSVSPAIQVYTGTQKRENKILNIRVGFAEAKGMRSYMEDRSTYICRYDVSKMQNLEQKATIQQNAYNDDTKDIIKKKERERAPYSSIAYFGIYDGHNGEDTSSILKTKLHDKILLNSGVSNLTDAILNGCALMDNELIENDTKLLRQRENQTTRDTLANENSTTSFSGSAAVFVIISRGTGEDFVRLNIGNIGDSRAVLCRSSTAIELTKDHKASTEKERIEKAGGFVHNGRLNGVLAISRSFGDIIHKLEGHLIATPDVFSHTVNKDDQFLLLASDGLFDVLTSQESVNFILRKLKKHHDVQLVAQELVAKAKEHYSHDNVSVMVICLNQR